MAAPKAKNASGRIATFSGSTTRPRTWRAANPKNAPLLCDPGRAKEPGEKTRQSEQARRDRNLDKDVVAVGQRACRLDMLRISQGRDRVERGPQLAGAGTQERVMQHVVTALDPHPDPEAEGRLSSP